MMIKNPFWTTLASLRTLIDVVCTLFSLTQVHSVQCSVIRSCGFFADFRLLRPGLNLSARTFFGSEWSWVGRKQGQRCVPLLNRCPLAALFPSELTAARRFAKSQMEEAGFLCLCTPPRPPMLLLCKWGVLVCTAYSRCVSARSECYSRIGSDQRYDKYKKVAPGVEEKKNVHQCLVSCSPLCDWAARPNRMLSAGALSPHSPTAELINKV